MANTLNKINSGGIKDDSVVNADIKSDAAIAGSKLADDSIAEVKLDISNTPSDGQYLQYKDSTDKLTWASSAGITDGDKGDITVSSSGATWTVDADAITYAKIQNVSATDRLLGRDSSGAGVIEEITPANVRTMLNVADGATNVTNTNQLTNGAGFITATLTEEQVEDFVGGMVTGNTETGITVTYEDSDGTLDFVVASQTDENFTTADHSKLDGIEASADVTDATNVNAAGAVMNSDLDGKGEILIGDGSGDPTALAVGTNDYVLTADSSEATGVKWAAAAGGSVADGSITTAKLADNAVTLAKMAGGTDGQIITYDANGDPIAVGPGTDGQVLTSTGAGSPPAFEAVSASSLASDAQGNTLAGTNAGDAFTGTDAVSNTLIGFNAGTDITTGDQNVCIGSGAAANITTSSGVTAIGTNTLTTHTSATTLYYTTVIGANAAYMYTGSGLTAIGANAANSLTTAAYCTYIGSQAGKDAEDGDNNTAIGSEALYSLTTGSNNFGIGYQAGYNLTTCLHNTAVGTQALYKCSTNSQNLAFGGYAARYATGSGNCAFGYKSMEGTDGSTSGSYNCSFGEKNLDSIEGGNYTTCIGYRAGRAVTSGNDNTIVGAAAGSNITTGDNNTCLGHDSTASSATVDNEITLGDSNIATLRCQVQSISSLSDRRDKTDIKQLDLGLDFINSLKPVKFKWDSREGIGKDGTYEAGFIAQDFQEVQKDYDADYLKMVLETNPEKLEAAPGKLIPILVKAVQDLSAKVATLEASQ